MNFSILFGVLFSIVGFFVGLYISQTAVNDDYKIFFIYSSIAAFLTAFISAYLLIERRNKFTNNRIILTSIFVGFFSHWVCWGLLFGFEVFLIKGSLFDFIEALYSVFAFCLWSWFFFGWITVPGSILAIYVSRQLFFKYSH